MKLLELFSGSGSIGKVFKQSFEVTSLDSDPKARATITCDILDWDFEKYEPGHFDVIWASPPCTEFSIAKTVGKRDLEKADAIVRRTLAIITYLRPNLYWFIENPATGLLKTRPYMQGLPSVTLDYCKYDMPYRKRTQIWTNAPWTPRPLCRYDCGRIIPGTRMHEKTAQHGKEHNDTREGNQFQTKELYAIPSELVEDIYAVCESFS